MNNQHQITPPPELVQQWREESSTGELHFSPQYLATQAARWGSDQELEACCLWLDCNNQWAKVDIDELRDARRPKPPSLKKQALEELDSLENMGACSSDIIRRALEALPND